jgi:hypothetical protein
MGHQMWRGDKCTVTEIDTLVISDGATTIATLQLAGNHKGDTFHLAADGHGGKNITLTTPGPEVGPPDAGHRFVAAMAGLATAGGATPQAAPGLHLDAWREMLTAPRMRLA